MLQNLKNLWLNTAFFLLTADGSKLIADIHIERGAHGVLSKNKNYAKIFIARPYNNLPQKTSCGQGIIFARRAQVCAKGRETIFCGMGFQPTFFFSHPVSPAIYSRGYRGMAMKK
jgi:hypothetical protein